MTVNLAPADLKKEGALFDLPIALGVIASEGVINPAPLQRFLVAGEVSLDGRLKPVLEALPIAIAAKRLGLRGVTPHSLVSRGSSAWVEPDIPRRPGII